MGARVTDGGVRVLVTGEGAGEVPTDADHLIVATMARTFAAAGPARADGLELTCVNRIPHARGLGSSSAAIVAGILLARELAGRRPTSPTLTRCDWPPRSRAIRTMWRPACSVASPSPGRAPTAPAPCASSPSAEVRPTVFIPDHPRPDRAGPGGPAADRCRTPTRRSTRPGRPCSCTPSRRSPSLLLEATEDRLHQPYRAPGMPATAALFTDLREQGVPACVSGAGPSVLALAPVDGIQPAVRVVCQVTVVVRNRCAYPHY